MKLMKKLIATILTVMMLTGYITTLTNVAIAAAVNLNSQNSKTNHTNVEFNSYFEGGEYSKTFEIGKEAKLYLNLQVNNTGYLKNGVVQFECANFEIDTSNFKNDKVQSSTKNEIKLKQINNSNEYVMIEVPIVMLSGETVDRDIFSRIAKIKFTGSYIDENGKEKFIQKELENEVQWEGKAEIQLAGEVSKYLPYEIGNQKGVLVQVKIRSNLKDNSLPIYKTKLEIDVPEITNSKPERVTVVANSTMATNGKTNSEVKYTYNEETGKIEIEAENNEENGKISWKKNAVDEYLVNYIYTKEEVYTKVTNQLEKAKATIKTEEQTNQNAITGEIKVKAEIENYNSKQTKTEVVGKISYRIEEAKGEMIDTTISATSEVSKGYIYANYAKIQKGSTEANQETNYIINYEAQINDKALIEAVEFNMENEKYISQEGQEYSTNPEDIYTKTIKIAEENFEKMLGEEGKVEILDKNQNKLAEINEGTAKDEKGNYSINITEAKVNEISIRTSKPITEGSIIITVEKAITGTQGYQKAEMETFKNIETQVITKVYSTQKAQNENQEEVEVEVESFSHTEKAQIALTEPVSKAEISISTQNLSTTVENTNVELRAVLDTSSTENALFKNPTLQIILPENIEKLSLKSVDLLLEDELKIKETKVEEVNGRKIIQVILQGTQTKYMNNGNTTGEQTNMISKGANIVIKANITFQKLTPSASKNIYLCYTNENTELFDQYYQKPETRMTKASRQATYQEAIGMAKTGIEIVAPNGVITENHMTNFKENGNISNVTQDKQEEKIDANVEGREVSIGGTIVNNYSNNIENVFILGRIPFSGNKQIDVAQDLGSNFTMPMKEKITISGIDSSKVKIYYSTNEEATKNLVDANNGWTEEPIDLTEIKSYLIVITGELSRETQIGFNYKAELPANIKYNNNSYTTYKVYYDNKMEDATLGESKLAGMIGLTTGQGPELKVEVKSNVTTAKEGQIVTMTATIKNVGGLTAENAKLLITAPESTNHTEQSQTTNYYYEDSTEVEKEIQLGSIKPGETITKSYELKINKLVNNTESSNESGEQKNTFPGEKDIQNIVRVTATNMTGEVKSEGYNIRIKEGDLSIISSNDHIDKTIKNADNIKYRIEVKNISNSKDLNNVTVTIPIPTNMQVKGAYYTYNTAQGEEKQENIVVSSKNVTINLGTLKTYNNHTAETTPIEDTAYITLKLTSQGFTGNFDYVVTAKADGIEEHQSNSNTIIGKETKLAIEAKPLDSMYISEDSEFTYKFIVKNIGEATTVNNKVEVIIPEGTSLEKASYTYKGETKTKVTAVEGKVTLEIYTMEPDDQAEINVTVKAKMLPDDQNKEITMWASIEASGVQKIESNQLKAIIEYDESLHPDGSSWTTTPDEYEQTTSKYKITGTAWIDENKDGKRDETEELLAGVQVILVHKSNSQIVRDERTGNEKITTTGSDGKYEFVNLKPDEYLVVFLYDAGKYSITDYQKEGISESINSDATNMKVILDGKQRLAGVSNTIKITNKHVRNIDIGLFIAEKFDLRLEKYISKVTATTPNRGTKTYNYNNSKIAKYELAKNDIGKTQLVIEYKIVVTNEGQVEGYAKKIVDYLPENMKFSSELNKDWYISNNNSAVYNTSLENEKLLPGQSKEVKLILSTNITQNNIGKLINNNAEIYESYNELGLEDIDSTPANKLEIEDDMSNADIIIAIATGRIILYTTLAIVAIALLGIGAYEIKKRVIIKKSM